jgi:hypothetical protein
MTTSSNSVPGGSSMSTEAIQCPKCNEGVMVQGFIIDWQGSKFSRVSNWVEGVPGKPSWFGTTIPVPAEKCIAVGTFRCSVCGFLESYAHPKFAAK